MSARHPDGDAEQRRYSGLDPDGVLYGKFVDMDGEPVTVAEWARLYEDMDSRVLARDTVRHPDGTVIELRTMWTGMRDPWALVLPYGTVADRGEGYALNVLAEYDTRAAALKAHANWVATANSRGLDLT